MAATSSLCDENGVPLPWEFKYITSRRNEDLRESCTTEVQVTGKSGMFRQKLRAGEYNELAACVQKFQGFDASFGEKSDEAKN